jgi:membrane protein
MDSPASRVSGAENCFAVAKTQPSDSLVAGGPPSPFVWIAHLLGRRPAAWWMSLGLVLGWIVRRLLSGPGKQPGIREKHRYELPGEKPMHQEPKERRLRIGEPKGPNLLSTGIELCIAVAMNLLKTKVKSWASEIDTKRKALVLAETDPVHPLPKSDPVLESLQNISAAEMQPPPRVKKREAAWFLLKTTATQWVNDKCPQLGAALAYFTVFSLAPLVLILLAFFGLFFGSASARDKVIEQLQYLIDPSGIKVIKDIATSVAKPQSSILATGVGIVVGLFGASGVFGQLQDALNTIWGVKPKPGASLWAFFRARFLSFAMVAGVCFLLLVSLTVESILRGLSAYLQILVPGGHVLALVLFLVMDIGVVILLFAMIFRFLPDVKIKWRDVWVGATLTAILFAMGKFLLGLYLGSGAAGSAYGAASSLITLLLWIYYSAQILLFGAEFTQVYANSFGSRVEPEDHAVRVKRLEVEVPPPVPGPTKKKSQRAGKLTKVRNT